MSTFLDKTSNAVNLSIAFAPGINLSLTLVLTLDETSPAKGIKKPAAADNIVVFIKSSPLMVLAIISFLAYSFTFSPITYVCPTC